MRAAHVSLLLIAVTGCPDRTDDTADAGVVTSSVVGEFDLSWTCLDGCVGVAEEQFTAKDRLTVDAAGGVEFWRSSCGHEPGCNPMHGQSNEAPRAGECVEIRLDTTDFEFEANEICPTGHGDVEVTITYRYRDIRRHIEARGVVRQR